MAAVTQTRIRPSPFTTETKRHRYCLGEYSICDHKPTEAALAPSNLVIESENTYDVLIEGNCDICRAPFDSNMNVGIVLPCGHGCHLNCYSKFICQRNVENLDGFTIPVEKNAPPGIGYIVEEETPNPLVNNSFLHENECPLRNHTFNEDEEHFIFLGEHPKNTRKYSDNVFPMILVVRRRIIRLHTAINDETPYFERVNEYLLGKDLDPTVRSEILGVATDQFKEYKLILNEYKDSAKKLQTIEELYDEYFERNPQRRTRERTNLDPCPPGSPGSCVVSGGKRKTRKRNTRKRKRNTLKHIV
jgi:hypothetical protein